MTAPIASTTILTTAGQNVIFTGYDAGTSTVDGSGQSDLSVAQLSSDFFIRIDGVEGNNPGPGLTAGQLAGAGSTEFANGELFLGSDSDVTTSGSGIGLSSDTLQKGEVVSIDFYNYNPTGLALPPNATASTVFFKFENRGSTEDVVIILKLVDPDDNTTTTKAIIVDAGDFFTSSTLPPSAFGISLTGSQDAAVIIESNDYNILPGENWVISGAQVMTSTEGITGTGINLVGTTGAGGGSSSLQEFEGTPGGANPEATTSDNDVIKISSVGIITQTTTTPDANLTFDVTIKDADGDTASQQLNVTIEGSNSFTGTALADSIYGSAIADIINGLDGNDTLIGGLGLDTLTGGTGADIFVIDPSHLTLALDDLIVDYNQAQGDKIDLTDLFQVSVAGTTDLDNYVRITGSNLEVDANGTVGGATFTTVATFTAVPTTINILFTDQNGNEADGTV
jgi:RTX calcium-binding nonapeptide repeat (4 copies)